ncbi:aminotransferase class I/II-fold pyridoxal phosphate-dependent enzyme [uncultured Dialister sp.]|jgi:aminotransferase|uniref:pyridoxal phosphate-dependent aminotransferase n=1 Tax=uncultured Dialister sp. TaxID=278064 RepID=UPI0026321044|nr:aminotransferase class I/II-fold pyridoxal phosphate-dependent enzyme [uncultured Dialister sp.]
MNWDEKFASNIKAVPFSGIRKFFDLASTMKDVISLGVGEPDYSAPDKVIDACIESLKRKETSYTSNWGLLELREEIAKLFHNRYHVDYDPKDEIMVTVGVSEAIGIIMTTLLNPGDEVLIPDPAYLAYPACVSIAGGKPVLVPTYEKDEFKLTVEELEKKVTPRTKAILIGYPNNPTGTVMDRDSLMKLAAFAEKHDLIVISDEIYCDLTYEGTHTCFASLPGMRERTLTMNGFSKSYAMTGLRIGYVCGPREALEEIYKVHQYEILCASTTSQYGAIAALRYCDDDVKAMYNEYTARREMVYDGLVKMGLPVFKPKGAFYIFPDISSTGMDDEEFADRLLTEAKVGVVPGTCFGPQGRNHVRISYAASRENLAEALKRMGEFVEKYRK